MGSPQKHTGQLMESPYAKHLSQYPSQSEGFVPNDFGGKARMTASTPSKQQYYQSNNSYHSSSRRGGGNRYFNLNNRGNNGNNGGGGYRNNYQNNYNHQQQNNRYSNSGNRQQPYHGQRYSKSDASSRNEYYHPTMLEDPWKDLLDRHNAIKNSQINAPSTSVPNDEDEDSSPETDSLTQENPTSTAIPSTTSDKSSNNISS